MPVTYSSDTDVKDQLGTLQDRLPSFVSVERARSVAYAELKDALAAYYPNGLPLFAADGAEVVKVAEACLAAADILDAIRINIDTVGDAPERLRARAWRMVDGGVVGYPPGSTTGEDDEGNPVVISRAPKVSSFTPLSAFPDPYAEARGQGLEYE